MTGHTVRALSWAFVTAMALLLLGGCASRKEIVGFQEDTRVMRSDLEELKTQQALILEALGSLDSDLSEMRARSEYGSSALEERIEQLAAQLNDILNRMDRSLAPLEELARKEAKSDTTGRTGINVDIFDAAMQDLSLGNYDLAEVGFLQFLQENPDSRLANDARYGLAETFYARARYQDAAAEYMRVIDNEDSKKVPPALLKLGLCYKALGRRQEARLTWQRLIEDYPDKEEAMVARQRLEELRGQ
ncbi:tol-pal system protein YbgF [bacterium]|nr:tol-pal system protein YbgF [bacterium]MBU1636349.1 tol-pal system protein YbgF [bacterium]MBU1920287.1 tol-pal system protein YbgF [bacterium]